MSSDSFKFDWCEEHQRPCDELVETDEGGGYYECPECERERSIALYDGPHYDCLNPKEDKEQPVLCLQCNGEMVYRECKRCKGHGYRDTTEWSCPDCDGWGGEWVCPTCQNGENGG